MARIPVPVRIGAVIVATAAFYSHLGQLVPQVELHPPEVVEASVPELTTAERIELGRIVFDGKGLCATCHTRGDRPISPAFPDLADIGARAGDRIEGLDAVAYLSHTLYEPRAFVVPGYPPSMPPITQPPIALADEEVRNVIAYLQSLGGEPTITASTTLPVELSDRQRSAIVAAMEAPAAPATVAPKTGVEPTTVAATAPQGATASMEEPASPSVADADADADTPVARGAALYALTCAVCHGARAEGNVLFNAPRLAGQEDWYVARQLRNFAQGIRGADPQDVYGLQMRPMAMALEDDTEITDIAAYLSSME